MEPTSPFLTVERRHWLAANDLAFAIPDRYPVTPGHTLLVPHRLVATWWDATRAERIALLDLADTVRGLLAATHAPTGWNLGVNIGSDGGQTIAHLHVHLIPRTPGDVDDPRGGVRHVVPARGRWQTLGDPLPGDDGRTAP